MNNIINGSGGFTFTKTQLSPQSDHQGFLHEKDTHSKIYCNNDEFVDEYIRESHGSDNWISDYNLDGPLDL